MKEGNHACKFLGTHTGGDDTVLHYSVLLFSFSMKIATQWEVLKTKILTCLPHQLGRTRPLKTWRKGNPRGTLPWQDKQPREWFLPTAVVLMRGRPCVVAVGQWPGRLGQLVCPFRRAHPLLLSHCVSQGRKRCMFLCSVYRSKCDGLSMCQKH